MTATLNSLLRQIEGEARTQERLRIADTIRKALIVAESHDHRQIAGRPVYGLRQALDLVPTPNLSDTDVWTEHIAYVAGPVDGVDVGLHTDVDGDGALDPMPFRLQVADGADLVIANAYLELEQVDGLIDALSHARTRWAQICKDHETQQQPPVEETP